VTTLGATMMNGATSWREDRPLKLQLVRATISKLRRRAQVEHMENAMRDTFLKVLFLMTILSALAAVYNNS
jgi:hypothetical protein